MAEDLFIPKMGQTVEEVTIISWQVKDGDKVEQGQTVMEVETDKAVFDVEAPEDGYIHIGPYAVDDVVPVLTVVAVIGEADDVFKVEPAGGGVESDTPSEPTAVEKKPAAPVEASAPVGSGEKVFASPRARKLADEKGVDLSAVTPTGGKGTRVREEDVVAYLARQAKASPIAKEASVGAAASVPASLLPSMEVSESIPLRGVRGVTAERMAASARATARVTLMTEADATVLVQLRERLKVEKNEAWGFKPGYNELLAKACSQALRRFPYMNARLNDDVIEYLSNVNIGIAVDSERGLYVPVLHDVDQKDLRTLGQKLRQRIEEIRAGKILPDHLSGGTFTITNLGTYDVDGFTPVINLPETAILGVGRIAPQPVVRAGKVEVRNLVTLSLVFDHRLVDGAPAARFLKYLKDMIEDPNEVLLTQ
jgi:pyruvate dehydrogenase E2 component (dihydrolipoamide acetyltransferase)